jgi:hypothetical protein
MVPSVLAAVFASQAVVTTVTRFAPIQATFPIPLIDDNDERFPGVLAQCRVQWGGQDSNERGALRQLP